MSYLLCEHCMIKDLKISELDNSLIAERISKIASCWNPELGSIHFADLYAKVVGKRSNIEPISLTQTQVNFLYHINTSRYSINDMSRQTGSTAGAAIYIAWRMLFQEQQNIAVVAPNLLQSKNLVRQVRFIIEHCPAYLRLPFERDAVHGITLSNGSSVTAHSFEANSLRGRTVDFLYVDGMANVSIRKSNEMLSSVLPAMAHSEQSQVAITSSLANSSQAFSELWDSAGKEGALFSRYSCEKELCSAQ